MVAMIVSGGFRILLWVLAVVGFAGLLLTAMIATPIRRPPELASISATAGAVDRSDMPGLERFSARDGTELASGIIRSARPRAGKSPSSSTALRGRAAVHALAKGFAARGVETFAPDIRGHGASGTRGDIGYPGQLEDDVPISSPRSASPTLPRP